MNEAARLVDELTTLLYEVVKRWQLQDGRVCEIVACGACRKKADKPESVVHDSDCPVYRLIRAEEANTAVIRANAEEIADLEDVPDELEAKVNALTAQMECRNELTARIRALTADRDDLRFRAESAESSVKELEEACTEWAKTCREVVAAHYAAVARVIQVTAERDALRARAERSEAAIREALYDSTTATS